MKPLVSVDELRRLMPQLSLGRAARYAPLLCAAMEEQDISSKKRRCAFLAQLAHESVQLRFMEEIASGAAYEGRSDLGNTKPGDGKRYKGRGPIQLTGRSNYRHFGRILELDLEGDPKLAAVPEHGFRIAALFWKIKGLNELADKLDLSGGPVDYQVFRQITRKINGGFNGLDDRWKYFKSAIKALHSDEEETESSSPQPAEVPEEPAAPAEPPTATSAQSEDDLFGAAVNSGTVKKAGLKLWPRIVKHSGAGLTWLYAFYEANKFGFVIVLLVILGGLGWLVYHNRKAIKAQLLRLLK